MFFRKGIFYELFEADAQVAHREFGLALTNRVSMIMCGMPVKSFEERAGELLAKGYKVARVDQAESHVAMEKRVREGGRAAMEEEDNKLIKRTVTEILTPGTLQDPQIVGGSVEAPRIISIWEGSAAAVVGEEAAIAPRVFGVCVIESATHTIMLGSFSDDARLSRLETILLRAVPKEALFCKGAVSPQTMFLLRGRIARSLIYLRSPAQFWDADHSRRVLQGAFNSDAFPQHLRQLMVGDHAALCAAGGCLAYLEELGLLQAVLSAARVLPLEEVPHGFVGLDGTTLINLNILEGPHSMLQLLNHTRTAPGGRLLRQWVAAPLTDPVAISARLDCTDAMLANPEWTAQLRKDLDGVPDLERLVALCAVGTATPAKLTLLVKGLQRAWALLVNRFVCNKALSSSSSTSSSRYLDSPCALLEEAATLVNAALGAALKEQLWDLVTGNYLLSLRACNLKGTNPSKRLG